MVVTHLPGVEAIVQQGQNGFLVDNVEDMYAPVCRILSDKALAAQLSLGSEALDLSPWSSDYMAQQLEVLYVKLRGINWRPTLKY